MKLWVAIVLIVLAILITFLIAFMVNKAKLNKAAQEGKIVIAKQSYTLVKAVNPVVAKTELNRVTNQDGTITVSYTDGSTTVLPKPATT